MEAPIPQPPFCEPHSPLRACLDTLAVAARTEAPIYLQGESGTGKEALARFVHAHSPRSPGPFVAVNCAAISPQLLEAELFGVEKGAYTGAHQSRPGLIRQAQKGTLFLDEIGDMPLEAQTRLLRVLQEKLVLPVGGEKPIAVDFRCICATHHDLRHLIRDGQFRSDLFYRLNVFHQWIPPLRDRRCDIPGLLRLFLGHQLSPEDVESAMLALPSTFLRYAFPGNVRELQNLALSYVVQRALGRGWSACVLEEGLNHLSPQASHQGRARAFSPVAAHALPTSRVSDADILKALESQGWHRAKAAQSLGISRRTLQYRISRWNRSSEALYI
jgi:transcriptional regulator with PAS, ATPase and Fis domain